MNAEIQCICKKLKAGRKLQERADYFLRKLNRKTNGSMGSVDMLKYLICVDLSYRDLGLKWDVNIANTLGLKSKKYHNTFNKIQNKLNISKNKTLSFDELIKHFKCNHVQSMFHKIYKKYQTNKMNQLPLIQRKYTNFATPTHKAAVFYVVATKYGKIVVNDKELCNMMHCEWRKFQYLCADVRQTCFQSTNAANNEHNNNNNNRKRTRDEFEMYCDDDYESRKDRKHREWKERILKESASKSNGNTNKRRKITQHQKPTKVFPIFEKAKRKKEENEEKEEEPQNIIDNTDDSETKENDAKKPVSAADAARIAALKRQQMM